MKKYTLRYGGFLIYFPFCPLFAHRPSYSPIWLMINCVIHCSRERKQHIITAWPVTDVNAHLTRRFTLTWRRWGPVPGKAATSATAAMCSEWAEQWSISQREAERGGRGRGETQREYVWGDEQTLWKCFSSKYACCWWLWRISREFSTILCYFI